MPKKIISIDPGESGGIVWETGVNGKIDSCPMPDGMTGLAAQLQMIVGVFPYEYVAVVEQVGTYRPGNSGPSAVKFARHCGHIEAVLYCLGIETEQVLPRKWQAHLPLTRFEPLSKTLPEAVLKKERSARNQTHKSEIKEYVQRRFPYLRITLKTADAAGIYLWYKEGRT